MARVRSDTAIGPTFGQALRQRRHAAGMRPEHVAVMCGVSATTVGHWEADRKRPRGDHMMVLLTSLFDYRPPFDTRMNRKRKRQAA